MYDPLAPFPFAVEERVDYGGWSLAPWTPGEKGKLANG